MSIAKTFAAVGVSATSTLRPGQKAAFSVTGTYTGVVTMEKLVKGGGAVVPLADRLGALISVTDTNGSGLIENTDPQRDIIVQFRMSGTVTGSCVCALTDLPPGLNVTAGIGAPNGATVSVREESDGILHKTTLFFTNLPLILRNTEQGLGVKVYDFPEGRILFLGAVGAISINTTTVILDTLNGAKTLGWGLGSTTQANGTLATTEQDLIPVTAITSSATINVAGAVSKGQLAAALQLDGTATPVDCFLNVGVPTADDIDADATVLINGQATITWINLGDV
jgi:hypothetical protein